MHGVEAGRYGPEKESAGLVVLAVPKLCGNVYGSAVGGCEAEEGAGLFVAGPELGIRQHEINNNAMDSPHKKFVKVMAVCEPVGQQEDLLWGEVGISCGGGGVGRSISGGLGGRGNASVDVALLGMSFDFGPI